MSKVLLTQKYLGNTFGIRLVPTFKLLPSDIRGFPKHIAFISYSTQFYTFISHNTNSILSKERENKYD